MTSNNLQNSRGGTRTRDPGIMRKVSPGVWSALSSVRSATVRHRAIRSAPYDGAAYSAAWFFVIQSSGGADRPHIHALIAGTQALSGRQLAATWRFGYTRVVRYDPSRSACGYVSREILESSDDHDLSARLPTLLSTCPTAELRPRTRLMLPAA